MVFEEGAGVLEVLFGVGFGGGDTLKRFVEEGDDAPLFGERGEWDYKLRKRFAGEVLNARPLKWFLSVPSKSLACR